MHLGCCVHRGFNQWFVVVWWKDAGIGGGQGWPFEAMLNNLTATALGGKNVHEFWAYY